MSAGEFDQALYQASYGDGTSVHPIKVQPETRTAVAGTVQNDLSALVDQTSPISAVVSRGRTSRGLNARLVYLQLTGTPPTGYQDVSRTRIPALTPAFFAACLAVGAEITYLSTTWKCIGSSAEKVK